MLARIQNFCQDYYDQIPKDTLKAIGISGVFTFTVCIIFRTTQTPENSALALTKASLATLLAVTATIIHAVTTPIFNYLFDNPTNEFSGCQQLLQYFFTLVVSGLLIHHSTSYKVNVATVPLFPHTLIKMSFAVADQIWSLMDTPGGLLDAARALNFDYKSNPAPVYLTI